MYNQKIKEQYLDDLKIMNQDKSNSLYSRVLKLFNAVESYEEIMKKDIAEISGESLIYCLKRTVGLIYTTKSDMRESVNSLKKYKEWYFNNINRQDDVLIKKQFIKGEDIDCYDLYYLKFVKDDKDFVELSKMIFQKSIQEDENLYNSLLITSFFIFNGVPLKSISSITKSDIDFENNTICFSLNKDKHINTRVSMLPAFIPYYKKINFDDKGNFKPIEKKVRNWEDYFSYKFNVIMKDVTFKNSLKLNFLHSPPLPVVVSIPLIKLNGQLTRVYLQQQNIKSMFMFEGEKRLRDFDTTFENFLKAFYI